MKTAYLDNTLLIANLTKSVNANYIAGFLPELRNTKKNLYKNELKEIIPLIIIFLNSVNRN